MRTLQLIREPSGSSCCQRFETTRNVFFAPLGSLEPRRRDYFSHWIEAERTR